MNQPNSSQVDERLRAVLLSAMQRDPDVLTNADHLDALLADLAPDMPPGLRSACVAVARTNATNWLVQTPPYSEEQVVAWLRAQYPSLTTDVAHQAVAAVAQLNGARPAPVVAPAPAAPPAAAPGPPPAPVYEQPTVAGTVAGAAAPHPSFPPATPVDALTQAPMHPSLPPNQGGWPPQPPPQPGKGRRTAIILAVVAVLLIAGGVGAFFAFKGDGSADLAAPRKVTAKLDGFGAVAVSWQPVEGADHYTISDTTGRLDDQVVEGTSYVFAGAANADHRFVVAAVNSDGDAGAASAPVSWAKPTLTAPTGLTITQSGADLTVSWDPVLGASGYNLQDLADSTFQPGQISGTSYVVAGAAATRHEFSVHALNGTVAGPTSLPEVWTPQGAELTAEEAQLAAKLTSKMVDQTSCRSANEESPLISAAIACDPADVDADGPQVLYALQLTPGSQDTFEEARFPDFVSKAGCDDDYPEPGTQGVWQLDGSASLGDVYCFSNAGTNVFAWTYYDEDVVLQIEGESPTTRAGLYAWWGPHVTLLQ